MTSDYEAGRAWMLDRGPIPSVKVAAPLHFKQQYRLGAHPGPEPPARCGQCGRRMVVEVRRDRWQPYDRETGQVRIVTYAKCSRPWWANIFGVHDLAMEDEDHQWPWLLHDG